MNIYAYSLYYYLKSSRSERDCSRKKLEEIQWKGVKEIIKHAYDNVPFYRQKFKRNNIIPDDIKTKEDLSKIPITTKQELKENFPHHTVAKNYDISKCSAVKTSGATGEPLHFVIDKEGVAKKVAINLRTANMAGYAIGKKMIQVAPSIEISSSTTAGLLNRIIRRKEISVFETNYENTIHLLHQFKPNFIVGYTSYIKILADYLEQCDTDGNKFLKAIITNSETLLPQDRRNIENIFNAEIFDHYGSVEFGRIGGECEFHDGYHINMDSVLIEVVELDSNENIEPGESGKIVVTGLLNYAMPFIRYEIGDLGTLSDELCSCGRESYLIKEIKGRLQDILLSTDGARVLPDYIYRLLRDFHEIKNFQVIQKSRKETLLKVVESPKLSEMNIEKIRTKFQEYLGDVSIEVESVEDIPREAGKFKHIVSKI